MIQKSGEPPESHRPDWDRGLQLLVAQRGMSRRRSSSNCADYVPAICTHRPSLFPMVGEIQVVGPASCREDNRYLINRGSKSRNKVAVGEPAAGSFFRCYPIPFQPEGGVKKPPLTQNNLKICRSTPVEHGSHNVSRWMTWLSISLKNAAACDKWYQLQNHSITESLNANGAWEKPFVGHPRACHSQCRTNKTKAPCVLSFGTCTVLSLWKNKSPSSGEAPSLVRGRLAWCLLCGQAVLANPYQFLAARLAQPNCSKRNIAFSLCIQKLFLVYRPEHGRTTRRT